MFFKKLDSKSVTNEAFSVLLQFMYTSNLLITCQNIGEVYTAARKLGMDEALNLCVKILNGSSKQEVHSVYTYVTAKQLGLRDAWTRALRNMCKRFEMIVGTPEYQDLQHDQVIEYLNSDDLACRSEVVVYLAALKWISVQYLEREQFATDVIKCVRFPLMTLNEILACHNPPLLPGLTEIPEIKDMLFGATCFIAAKTVNEEKLFQKYSCAPRHQVMEKEALILWDPNIFDPEVYALYEEDQAATAIQAAYRGYQTRKSLSIEDDAATTIQANFRGYKTRKSLSIEDDAATTIQSNYRGYQTRQAIGLEHDAATTIQAGYRGYQTRKSLSTDYSRDPYDESDSDDSSQEETEKGFKMSFVDGLRKSVGNLFRRASSQVEEAERKKLGKDRSKDYQSREFGGLPWMPSETLRHPKWTPEVTSGTDALAGPVKNVPKGSDKRIDESKDSESKSSGRLQKVLFESVETPPPSKWTPEVTSSIDALTGPVKNVPKGADKRIDESNDSESKSSGRHQTVLFESVETPPPSKWTPEVTSDTDALAGPVKNVPKGGDKVLEEDLRMQKKRKYSEETQVHPHYSTEWFPTQRTDSSARLAPEQHMKPPPWLPEVSSSLDALAGTVMNMTKNLDVPEDKTKMKQVSPGDSLFEHRTREDSLDSIMAKEMGYSSKPKLEFESEGELFRSIIVTGGFKAEEDHDSELDITTGNRCSQLCCGSQDIGKLMFQYDPAADQWSIIGQMPKARHHHRLVYLDNVLYSIGGCDPSTTKAGKMVPLNTCYSLDLSSKKWKKAAKMRHCRMYHAVAALDGKIYAVGGKDDNDSMLDSVEVYDPKLNKWQELPDTLISPTMHMGLCAHKGQLWTLGGMVQNEGKVHFVTDVRCYCPYTKSWIHDVPNLPSPRAFVTAIECMNRVYVIGGAYVADADTYSDELDSLSEMLYFDEIRKLWRTASPLPEACHSIGAAVCGKSIFVLGGRNKEEILDQVVMFTESPERWYRCSTLPIPLFGFAAASIPKVVDSK